MRDWIHGIAYLILVLLIVSRINSLEKTVLAMQDVETPEEECTKVVDQEPTPLPLDQEEPSPWANYGKDGE